MLDNGVDYFTYIFFGSFYVIFQVLSSILKLTNISCHTESTVNSDTIFISVSFSAYE